jgi:hypothetical protein
MRFSFALPGAFCLALLPAVVAFARDIPLANPGFEAGATDWTIADKDMSAVVPEAARSGRLGLRVADTSEKAGSSCRSGSVPVTAGKSYALHFWGRALEGERAVAVYQQYFDAKGRNLTIGKLNEEYLLPIPDTTNAWQALTLYGKAPKGAVALSVWIHSFNGAKGSVDLDDFSLVELSDEEAENVRRERLLASSRGFPPVEPARVAEIAAWLAPAPHGLGRPASDRAAWERLAVLPEAAEIIRNAAKAMGKPLPDLPDELYLEFTTTGNRRNYERPYADRTKQLTALLLAECLEYKGRFLPALERDILAVCDERSWTMPAHDGALGNFNGTRLTIDLGSSARGWLLAQADFWLGGRLTPATRARLRAEVKRRVLDPYFTAVRENDVGGNWWMRGDNNWNAVCSAGAVCCALALAESREERAEALAAMEISNPFFIGGFTEDGYCSEGMGYWNYGFGHYVMMGLAVRAATDGKLDIFAGDKLARIAAYAKGYQIQPGRAPWFADGGGAPSAEVWALMRQVWPEAVPADFTHPLLRGSPAVIGLRAFGQEAATQTNARTNSRTNELPLRTFFPDAQVLITRSLPVQSSEFNVERSALSVLPFGAAVKGGHNAEHHNHNDLGSYTVVLDGVEMLGDPGGEIYTRRTFSRDRYVSNVLNSYGHPVPVVAGQLQATGRQSAARVTGLTFSDASDRIVLDLTAGYRVPELAGLRRAFTFDRTACAVTVIDDVRFHSPQTFSTPIVTYREITRKGDATLWLHDKTRCVELRIEAEGGAWRLDDELIENPGKTSPRRLAVTFERPVAAARVRFTVTPRALPAAPDK